MSVYSSPPRSTVYELKFGVSGAAVASLQRTLRQLGKAENLREDGVFSDYTHAAVVRYQRNRRLADDGVAGQKTQQRIVTGWLASAKDGLPDHLLDGVAAGESGYYLGAVNWSVAGGVDVGAFQRRVYGPPWDEVALRRAFDTRYQSKLLANQVQERHDSFRQRAAVKRSKNPDELAWRLAVLCHHYPYGASVLSETLASQWWAKLQTPQGWMPGARFDDGKPVRTRLDVCLYYSLGSREHGHAGRTVKQTYGLPTY